MSLSPILLCLTDLYDWHYFYMEEVDGKAKIKWSYFVNLQPDDTQRHFHPSQFIPCFIKHIQFLYNGIKPILDGLATTSTTNDDSSSHK